MRSQSLHSWMFRKVDARMWGNDAQFLVASAVGEVARKEEEEGLHLGVEGLASGGI